MTETLPRAFSALQPPPRLTVSEWADRGRKLSPEASAEAGQWYTTRAEFTREIMDCITRPEVEEVSVMKSAQTAITESLLNVIGYYVDQDPSPILDVEPDEPAARDFSVRRLSPMIRDTECLHLKVMPIGKKRENMFEKIYPGGILAVAWSTSASQLAARPIRVLTANDIDRFPPAVGREGDPYELARKRTQTFWNRKIFTNSTPTTRDVSKIEELFFAGNQQHYLVPCPHCDYRQKLVFGPKSQFAYLPFAKGMLVYQYDGQKVTDAQYQCGNCGKLIPENHKHRMIREGKWKALFPERIRHQSFHINELYSPWSNWREIAEAFEKKKSRTETLRTVVNLNFGETFAENLNLPTGDKFLDRRENYVKIPEGVIILTAAVDVQDDRLECYVEGWGMGEENWEQDHYIAEGSPGNKATWLLMETWLLGRVWEHENGFKASYGQIGGLMAVGVDTGGHFTKEAYAFVRRLKRKRFFALKGKGGMGIPLIFESRSKKVPVRLVIVGTDDAKQRIYDRLQDEKKGDGPRYPGFQHFNMKFGKDYFDQLLSEQRRVKVVGGIKKIVWEIIDVNRRNEALDCKVYNLAIYHKLNPNMDELARILKERMEQAGVKPEEVTTDSEETKTEPKRKKRRRLIIKTRL